MSVPSPLVTIKHHLVPTANVSFNHGQTCCAGSRIYVQKGIYEKFVAGFKKQTESLKVGDPFDESSYQGPQVSQLQCDRIMGYVESGKKEGATVITGGKRHGDKGYFIEPVSIAISTSLPTTNLRVNPRADFRQSSETSPPT